MATLIVSHSAAVLFAQTNSDLLKRLSEGDPVAWFSVAVVLLILFLHRPVFNWVVTALGLVKSTDPGEFTSGDAFPGDVWRDGETFVVRSGTELPDRCVTCNAPADGRRVTRRKLELGVCERHLSEIQRGNVILTVAAPMVLLGTGGLIASAFQAFGRTATAEWIAGLSILSMVLGVILSLWANAKRQLVAATRIEGDLIWVADACPAFLAGLTEFASRDDQVAAERKNANDDCQEDDEQNNSHDQGEEAMPDPDKKQVSLAGSLGFIGLCAFIVGAGLYLGWAVMRFLVNLFFWSVS